ncbi:PDZ domain-containing protein [Terriglobus roseus]|nr:PDZ domain-containing protein [Terriglobus roseus]
MAQTASLPVQMCSTADLSAIFAGAGFASFSGAHSQPPQGYLGIAFHGVNDGEIAAMHLKDGHGAEIIMVDHDGPAGKAGLREHDVVLSVNGVSIEGEDQLRKMLRDTPPGKSIALYICRNGVEQTVTAVMSTREEVDKQARQTRFIVPVPVDDTAIVVAPAEPPASRSGFGHGFIAGHLLPTPTYTGATVDAMGAQLADYFGVKDGKGLLVHEVENNSPAAVAGLRAGDVIVKMNGGRVATEKDWTRALHESKGRAVTMTVIRERREQVLTMVPDSKRRSSLDRATEPGASGLPAMMLR